MDRRRSCVIIDDDRQFLAQITRWFGTNFPNFSVHAFSSSVEAIDFVRCNRVELIVTAYLIAQIEKPLSDLFPSDSFTIKLSRNDSLSSLAKTYLGDSLSFYGLARYNDIPVPGKVSEGQTLRIPKTAESLQALARITAAAAAPPASSIPSVSTPSKSAKSADTSRKLADLYYERGLVAFQHQDLNTAIADWDKVLAIDPNHKDAQLSRAQAIRLKNNLAKLRK